MPSCKLGGTAIAVATLPDSSEAPTLSLILEPQNIWNVSQVSTEGKGLNGKALRQIELAATDIGMLEYKIETVRMPSGHANFKYSISLLISRAPQVSLIYHLYFRQFSFLPATSTTTATTMKPVLVLLTYATMALAVPTLSSRIRRDDECKVTSSSSPFPSH